MLKKNALYLGVLLLLGCAGARQGTAPVPTPSQRLGDPELYQVFAQVPLDSAGRERLEAYELAHYDDFLERVATVAEDPAAGTSARYNAVMLLGERSASGWISALRIAASDPDPRVRAAVVVAAARIMQQRAGAGRTLVVGALEDPSPEVQAKALELLGTSDLPLLHSFPARHPKGDVAAIARDFIVTAEQRGAPLTADSAGVLHRLMPVEGSAEFRPVMRWQQWQAAVGSVVIAPPRGASVQLDSIEVVRDILPLVFSPDGAFVAYERQRRIFVRDLRRGTVRDLGPGIAPRVQPFTENFLFFREDVARRGELRERTRLVYEVMQSPFGAGAEPTVLGTIGAFAEPKANGNYSPVRWVQVIEQGSTYTLEASGMETFTLPDPFKAAVPRDK